MDFGNAVVIFAILAVVFSITFIGYGFFLSGMPMNNFSHSEEKFEEFTTAELEDNCVVPEGYSEEDWKEHMSHHPDRYEGCLF